MGLEMRRLSMFLGRSLRNKPIGACLPEAFGAPKPARPEGPISERVFGSPRDTWDGSLERLHDDRGEIKPSNVTQTLLETQGSFFKNTVQYAN
jgi:hypothetical protein